MDCYYGEIRLFAGNYAPAYWAFCKGQLLPINQYNTLYKVIGTLYGGDGKVTFALPNLQGTVPLNQGTGVGLRQWIIGRGGGQATNTLTYAHLPNHSHAINGYNAVGNSDNPTGNIFAGRGKNDFDFTNATPNATMKTMSINPAGGNDPVNNMQPYLALNYIICLVGDLYPIKPS